MLFSGCFIHCSSTCQEASLDECPGRARKVYGKKHTTKKTKTFKNVLTFIHSQSNWFQFVKLLRLHRRDEPQSGSTVLFLLNGIIKEVCGSVIRCLTVCSLCTHLDLV